VEQVSVLFRVTQWLGRAKHRIAHILGRTLWALRLKCTRFIRSSKRKLSRKVSEFLEKRVEMKKRSEKIENHLKKEMKSSKRMEKEDKEFVASLKRPMAKRRGAPAVKAEEKKEAEPKKALRVLKKEISAGKKELKVKKVMREYKKGDLHSGSKKGPVVSNPKQAIAIALSESRKIKNKSKKK
jgi:hypothetical protein